MFQLKDNKDPVKVIVALLVMGNIFFALNYFFVNDKLKTSEDTRIKSEINSKVLDFTSLFIAEVLQAEGEVDFETRLKLENAMRGLEDAEIMTAWQNFVGSKTEIEAQDSVKDLMGLLVSKIRE